MGQQTATGHRFQATGQQKHAVIKPAFNPCLVALKKAAKPAVKKAAKTAAVKEAKTESKAASKPADTSSVVTPITNATLVPPAVQPSGSNSQRSIFSPPSDM